MVDNREQVDGGQRRRKIQRDAQGRAKMGPVFRVLWVLLRLFCRVFFLWKVTGEKYVKDNRGGCIVIANHTAYKDPVLLAVGLHQKIRLMAKEELYQHRLLGWLITRLGAFSISRHMSDTKSIRQSIAAVEDGMALVIFPEGTRAKGDELLPFERGVSYIALSAKAQVIPAYISSRRIRGRYRVNFGPAMDVAQMAADLPKKQRSDFITEQLRGAVMDLKRQQEEGL